MLHWIRAKKRPSPVSNAFGVNYMKFARNKLLIILTILICGASIWMLRGLYDEHFMMEGRFHIVSSASRDHKVTLIFPSGKQTDFNLEKGSYFDFKLVDTGEGSITILIDGLEREKVGYVTSMNSIIVLVIGDEQSNFSYIFT